MGLAVLRVNGLFLNHAIGVSCPSALETYEELLNELPYKLTFSKHTAHVPSFMEEYPLFALSLWWCIHERKRVCIGRTTKDP